MAKFRVLEREMVLHEIPYEVEADSVGEAFMKVAADLNRQACGDSDTVYEVNEPYMWEIYDAETWEFTNGYGAPMLADFMTRHSFTLSRQGFIGVREADA